MAELVHIPHRPMSTWPHTQPPAGPTRCGRPRAGSKSKVPCKATPMYGIAACEHHATYVERSKSAALMRAQSPFGGQALRSDGTSGISPYPACWFWPVSAEIRELVAAGELGVMFDWQDLRCAACGRPPDRLVEDHDHNTGWTRGYLCQSCNLREPGARRGDPHPISQRMARYRRWNPATILGVWEHYYHPLWGIDRGELGGTRTKWPHPVSRAGQVLLAG